MIASFLASWPLFYQAYLTAWLIGFLLSFVGVLVVTRDQIFIGAAVAQAATLGIALGMVMRDILPGEPLPGLHTDSFLSGMAVAFSILAALLTAHRSQPGHESHEATTGWVFLSSASLAILLMAHSPHGLAEIQRLVSSSLIGATTTDLWVFGVSAAGTVLFLSVAHRRVLLFAMDPAMAMAVGMRVPVWAAGVTVWLGLTVGLSLRVSGVLYTFGCLVLPALVAKNLCREVRPVFFVAPLIAVGTGGLGCVLADASDSPPAQMTIALLSLALIVAWGVRRLRQCARTSP